MTTYLEKEATLFFLVCSRDAVMVYLLFVLASLMYNVFVCGYNIFFSFFFFLCVCTGE